MDRRGAAFQRDGDRPDTRPLSPEGGHSLGEFVTLFRWWRPRVLPWALARAAGPTQKLERSLNGHAGVADRLGRAGRAGAELHPGTLPSFPGGDTGHVWLGNAASGMAL